MSGPVGRRGGRAGRVLVLLCALLALSACVACSPSLRAAARAQRIDLDGWHELRAEWFTLVADLPEDELRALAEEVALFVALAKRTTTMPEEPAARPARFFLLADPLFQKLDARGMDGFMVLGLDGFDSAVRLGPFTGVGTPGLLLPSRPVLFHEYTHFLLEHGKQVTVPFWYHEGFAELLSTVREQQGLVVIGAPPPGRVAQLAGRPLDLAGLFGARSLYHVRDPLAFYAAAWAVTHYLSTDVDRRAAMQGFVDRVAWGADWEEAYEATFDVPLDVLAERVRAHATSIAGGRGAVVVAVEARRLEVDRRFSVRALSSHEVGFQLADLLLRLESDAADGLRERRLHLADVLLARAVAQAPDEALYHAYRARTLASTGDAARSAEEAAVALAGASGDVEVLLQVAHAQRALCEGGLAEEDRAGRQRARLAARALYERAREADPTRPDAWAGIGWSYVGSGDPPAIGIQALEHALRLGHGRTERERLDLAELYRVAGRPERAIEQWEAVLRTTGSPQVVEYARRQIETLRGVESGDAATPEPGAGAGHPPGGG